MANQTTLKTIADKLDLSPTTVSRVLNGKAEAYRISNTTADAVLAIAAELDYSPNRLGRGLRIRQTHTLGLVIPDISNPFFAKVASNIEKAARAAGYNLVLCDSEEDTELEQAALRMLLSLKVDGLIVCPVGQEGEHLQRITAAGHAMVLVDRSLPDVGCLSVVSDDHKGAVEAVAHLVANGHAKIGCIQGLSGTSTAESRVAGYRAAMQEHGLPVDESLIVGDSFQDESGYRAAVKLLNRPDRPTALFVGGNLILIGVLRALQSVGLKVPDDVSVIGFDEQPYSGFLSTPMTTVSQEIDRMGQVATELLVKQIASGVRETVHQVVLPTTLISRDSVRDLTPGLQS